MTFSIYFSATIRPQNLPYRKQLSEFGQYVSDCLPKYVQQVQITNHDELEILIHPEGVLPTITFLRNHHTAQYVNIIDIAGVDVPSREYRFEVRNILVRKQIKLSSILNRKILGYDIS